MLRALLLILPVVTLAPGCDIASSRVMTIGVERATLTPKRATELSNGAWLIEGELQREADATETFTRYVYVHPEVVARELTRVPLRMSDVRRARLEYPSRIAKTGVVVSIFPPTLDPIDATLEDHVPAGLYRHSDLAWQPAQHFQVESDDREAAPFNLDRCRGHWARQTPIHYPAQVLLLPPAIAFDVSCTLAFIAGSPIFIPCLLLYGPELN